MPGANTAVDSTGTKYAYYGATETRDNPCTTTVESYHEGGMLKLKTEPDPDGTGSQTGRTTETVYDDSGQVVATRYNSDPWTCTTYDTRGRVVETDVPAYNGNAARTIQNDYAATTKTIPQPGTLQATAGGSASPATGNVNGTIQANTKATSAASSKAPKTKQIKSLNISPASIVMYKTNGLVTGVKPGIIDQIPLMISSSDGQPITYPSPSPLGIFMTYDFATKVQWKFTGNSSYASIGTQTIAFTATSVDKLTTYTGSVQVIVKQLPTFSISTATSYGISSLNDANYTFSVSGYSIGTAAAYPPTLALDSSDFNCNGVLAFTPDAIHCSSFTLHPAGTYTLNFVLENQFQKVILPEQLNILP